MTREEWLTKLVSTLGDFANDLQLEAGQKIWAHAKASCGFSAAKSRKRTFDVIPAGETADGVPQIYISPGIHDTQDAINAVFSALAALAGGTHKQNAKDFKKSLKTLESMREFATCEVKTWDMQYPQAALKEAPEKDGEEKEAGQALLKCVCISGNCHPDGEKPYVVRVTPKQALRGLPYCGICALRMVLDEAKKAQA